MTKGAEMEQIIYVYTRKDENMPNNYGCGILPSMTCKRDRMNIGDDLLLHNVVTDLKYMVTISAIIPADEEYTGYHILYTNVRAVPWAVIDEPIASVGYFRYVNHPVQP
jgi:hypothetical protein